jgi:hypothetical protein
MKNLNVAVSVYIMKTNLMQALAIHAGSTFCKDGHSL